MNLKTVTHLIAVLMIMEGIAMALTAGVSLLMKDSLNTVLTILGCGVFTSLLGLLTAILTKPRPGQKLQTGLREGFATVAGGWLIASIFGTLPFVMETGLWWHDAFFETVSGFTTTGSSVIDSTLKLMDGSTLPKGVESLSCGILFWRSMIQWIGGMGIVVLSLAILPMLGVGGQAIFNAEVPGVKTQDDQLTPKIASTAKILFVVYFAMTVLETLFLWFGGMTFFDAVCHSFTTLATGGFSTKSDSIAYYKSSYIQVVITIFMFLAGCNFILHYRIFTGMPLRQYLSEEFRFFAFMMVGATLIIATSLFFSDITDPMSGDRYHMAPWLSIRAAMFQVVTLATTTGFGTADYTLWPTSCGMILIGVMFMGACGGSTAGGIKCVRVMLLGKFCTSELRRCIFPRSLQDIRLNGKRVETPVLNKALGFLLIYIMTFFLFALILPMVCKMDLVTALSASLTSISNVGPGFGQISPVQTFAWMNIPAKLLLSLEMLIGRLELYTMLVIFLSSFWKK